MTMDVGKTISRNLSLIDFADLGAEDVGYVKSIVLPEGVRFHITTGSGETVAETDNYEAACLALEHFELEEATLH